MAAGHSVDPAGWRAVLDEAIGRIAGRFARREPRAVAAAFVTGLLSTVERKTCWSLAEQAGYRNPAPLQRLLRTAVWDADAAVGDVRGFIADRLSKQAAYTLNIAMTVIGVGALAILREPSQVWLLYVYVIFFGIGFGSRAVIFSALTADIFSGKGFGSILGYSTIAVGVGGALGSYLGGAFHDWTGSYLASFGLSALLLALSDGAIWIASMTAVSDYDKRLWLPGRVDR